MKHREEGYFWVKYQDEWIIAQYFNTLNRWFTPIFEKAFEDSAFDEIDENRILRTPTIKGKDLIIAIGNSYMLKGSDLIP